MIYIFGKIKKYLALISIVFSFGTPIYSFALNEVTFDGNKLIPKSQVFFEPDQASFLVGSTFDVPIYLNTEGYNINTINIKINFDQSKLSIIKPSGGKSILGIWLEPPSYDNKNGTASFVGVIPNGIVTSSGLIATITFKAISTGEAKVSINDFSSANLNDGIGTNIKLSLGRASYHINPKTPDGVNVYSETHVFQEKWYNNNSPIINWDSPIGIKGYSTILDNNPNTIPGTNINTSDNFVAYDNLKDGIWYFHVRANVNNIWGNTSHFQVRVDTTPPAFFAPTVDILKDNSNIKKYLLSFITTDSLSGIDHYEVGVIDIKEDSISSPIFIQSESPYVISGTEKNSRVFIRAYDNAGNIKESTTDLYPGVTFVMAIKKYALYLLMIATFLLLFELVLHYLFGHHIINHIRRAFALFKKVSSDEKYKKIEEEIEKIDIPSNNV